MAAAPRRAVYLLPIGDAPTTSDLAQEQVDAYKTVQKMTVLTRTVNVYRPQSRNAMREASQRVFAAQNFR
jgi:hypothetical protein